MLKCWKVILIHIYEPYIFNLQVYWVDFSFVAIQEIVLVMHDIR
jgi:hypothetical protein